MFSNFSFPSIAFLLVACGSDKGITIFNPDPEAEIISHSNGDEILEGYVVTLEGHVGDANHTAEQLTVEWKNDGETLCETSTPQADGSTFCDAVFSAGNTKIKLEVKDADGGLGITESLELIVLPSQPPSCQILTPQEDGIYYSDQLIPFSGTITDAEDSFDLLSGYWKSNVDGVLSEVEVTLDALGGFQGYGYLSEGEHAIELHGEDAIGLPCMDSVIITVQRPNTAPTAPSVSVSPDPATEGLDDLVCTLDGPSIDDDGDLVVYTYVWTDGSGIIQQTTSEVSSTTDTFLASGTTEGVWSCEVTPYDMTDYGPPSSAFVNIEKNCTSLDFDGVNDIIDWHGNALFGSSDTRYFEVLIKPDSLSGGFFWASETGISDTPGATLRLLSQSDGRLIVDVSHGHIVTDIYMQQDSWQVLYLYWDNTSGNYTVGKFNGTHFTEQVVNLSPQNTIIDDIQIGFSDNFGTWSYADGLIKRIRVLDHVPTQSDIQSSLTIPDVINAQGTKIEWYFSSNSNTVIDHSGNGNDGTVNGASWIQSCPEEDLDGDGIPAWEDCDDNDPSVQVCYTSCLDILNNGASSGDGLYVIDPSGANPLDVYCDMSTNGGGWTRVLNVDSGTCENGFLDEFAYFSFTQGMLVNQTGEWIMTDSTPYMNDSSGSGPSGVGNMLVSGSPVAQITLPEDLHVTFANGRPGWIGWNGFTRWDGASDSHFITIWRDCQEELGNVGGWYSHCSSSYGPGFGFGQQVHCTTSRGLFWNGSPYNNTIEFYLR